MEHRCRATPASFCVEGNVVERGRVRAGNADSDGKVNGVLCLKEFSVK